MTTKANRIRAAARYKAADPKHLAKEKDRTAKRETLLTAEAKAHLDEMRANGFCPPNAMPTVKQYSRFAAFKNSQAAASRANVIAEETAFISANAGLMHRVYERLADPKLKSTAFAQLAVVVQRQIAMAPQLVDETQRVSLATDSNIIDDAELIKVAKEFGVSL